MHGIQKKFKNIKKKPHHCHIKDSADSKGSGDNLEESLFYKDGI